MKAGPERELLDRYLARARAISRGLGVVAVDLVEVDEGRGRSAEERRRAEAAALAGKITPGSVVVAFDERGGSPTSAAFAERIGRMVEKGSPSLVLVIGGPDGLDETFRLRAAEVIGFGAATFPHQLARVILTEQVYRAFTILSGHPYHRG